MQNIGAKAETTSETFKGKQKQKWREDTTRVKEAGAQKEND